MAWSQGARRAGRGGGARAGGQTSGTASECRSWSAGPSSRTRSGAGKWAHRWSRPHAVDCTCGPRPRTTGSLARSPSPSRSRPPRPSRPATGWSARRLRARRRGGRRRPGPGPLGGAREATGGPRATACPVCYAAAVSRRFSRLIPVDQVPNKARRASRPSWASSEKSKVTPTPASPRWGLSANSSRGQGTRSSRSAQAVMDPRPPGRHGRSRRRGARR
jgi:hypothetical protein